MVEVTNESYENPVNHHYVVTVDNMTEEEMVLLNSDP
jgi:hypothetical protein